MKHKTRKNSVNFNKRRRQTNPTFLHPQATDPTLWQYLLPLLAVAFVLRGAVALSGDFVLHPDEIMQHLEPAHQLVFGNGILHWEWFYGARSWLVPSIAAFTMWLGKMAGFAEPSFYISAVKLTFCAISLLIPLAMYIFCRRHFGELTARIALVLGVFWYELVVFAHKPMSEFVASAVFAALLITLPLAASSWRRLLVAGALCVLVVASRMQYAPPTAAIFVIIFYLANKNGRWALLAGSSAMLLAVGALEMATWGAPFYSYYLNMLVNLTATAYMPQEDWWLPLLWLVLASGGLVVAAFCSIFANYRRRGLLILLLALIIISHILQKHFEYRFIFLAIPLWLILFADLLANAKSNRYFKLWLGGGFAVAISLLGIFNLLPLQEQIYHSGFSKEKVRFVRNQDSKFRIYRQLAASDKLQGLIDFSGEYSATGGYYYLGRAVPFYDAISYWKLTNPTNPHQYASHIITNRSSKLQKIVSVKGKLLLKTEAGLIRLPIFIEDQNKKQLLYWQADGKLHKLTQFTIKERFNGKILWHRHNRQPTQNWHNYKVIAISPDWGEIARQADKSLPKPPPKYGIRFID